MEKQTLKIALAQFAPVWMNRRKTLEKALKYAEDAADKNCKLVVLGGEASVGGYPYWLKLMKIFRQITSGNQWASFGFIAAEAELKRTSNCSSFQLHVT
jgi:predicted amidohydrolase